MGRTNVGRGGRRGGRSGSGRGLSDHEAARGWGQIRIRTNTTCSETNAGVQKSTQTNTSGAREETNVTISSDTRVAKSIWTNTAGARSDTNPGVQKSIRTNTTNTSGARSDINATMFSDARVLKSTQTNTSGAHDETNAAISSDTRVHKRIWTNTVGSRSETNTGVQKSTQTNTTNTSGARSDTNATMSSDARVQKSTQTNTSGTRSDTNPRVQKSIRTNTTNTSGARSDTNATMSSDARVQKSIQTNTSGTRSDTNPRVQTSIRTNTTNTSGSLSDTNATMPSDTATQEPVGVDEPNTDVSQRRRGSNIIEQVPQDPSKRTMISLDDGEFTDPKVVRKITSILKTMFNGSWTTWKEVDKSGRDELWAHFKELFKWEGLSDVLVHDAFENSMKKRFPDIMSKARFESVKLAQAAGVQLEGANCSILKPYNPEWIKSKHWEDMIDRVWNTPKWLNKSISGSNNRNTVKEGSVSKHCAGSITISQHKRKFEQEHKRPPTAAELFERTHMKKGAFITSKSERIAAAYNGAIVEKYGSDPANHPIYDDDLWKQCAGDDQKGGVFGWGSMSDPQYTMTGTPSTTRCTGAPSVQNYLDSVRGELKEELKEEMKVDLKEEMKADLKEEMKADLKEEMKADLKEEMKNQLMEEMREELKEEMREDLKEEMRKEIQGMLVDYGIKSRVTRQTKTNQGNASGGTS